MLTYLLELQLISLPRGIGATLNTKSLFYPTCLWSILANFSTTRFATFEKVHSWKVQISKPGKLVVTLLHLVSHLLTVSKSPGCLSAIFTRSQKCPELSGCWRQLTPYQRQDLFTTIVNHPFYRQQLYFYQELHINLIFWSEQLISFKGDWM